jgi:hypothetical protein
MPPDKGKGRSPAGSGRSPDDALNVHSILAEPPVTAALIPAGIPADDTDGDGLPALWEAVRRGDWSTSATAYATATAARRIITLTGMTLAAFGAECARRHITGWGSQSSVSRRLRWADLHDLLWEAAILPRGVFLSESATRPLFDGKLKDSDRLRLIGELFAPYLTDDAKRDLAEQLTAALMAEHLERAGHGKGYRAPRRLIPERVIARLLAQGMTADAISVMARRIENSARYAAGGQS